MTTIEEIKELRQAFDSFTQRIAEWQTKVEVRLAEGGKNFEAHNTALNDLSIDLEKLNGKMDTIRFSDRKAIIIAASVGSIVGSGLGIFSTYLANKVIGGG